MYKVYIVIMCVVIAVVKGTCMYIICTMFCAIVNSFGSYRVNAAKSKVFCSLCNSYADGGSCYMWVFPTVG